jgi:hypothetical protein
MKVAWPIEGLLIASTKNLSMLFCFYLFTLILSFKPPTSFSLRPDGGLRHSSWPCRPRITLKRASPKGVPLEEVIQGDQREIAQYTGADDQTAVRLPAIVRRWSDRLPSRSDRLPRE